jgi:hypothetical protein
MNANAPTQDVMQVCQNGHVITDRLNTFPERSVSHCDRCGAPTLERCKTCGNNILGAVHVPGLEPIGQREPPQFCSTCGASFPWTAKPLTVRRASDAVAILEKLLRRLPRCIRQLRVRQGDRPSFRVVDEHDLEDLLRSILPLHFDDVRPECRTASYSLSTTTDFLLEPENIVVTSKRVRTTTTEKQLADQVQEDSAHYELQLDGGTLVCFIYDPEMTLRERQQLETAWSRPQGELDVRCVIA